MTLLGQYNMMNMNGFGMGSFGMNGCNFFTNCDGTMNTNAMLGYGLTNMGLNLGMSIFNCYWGDGAGGSSKAKKEDPNKAELAEVNKDIKKELKKLGSEATVDNYSSVIDGLIKEKQDTVTTAQTTFDQYKTKPNGYDTKKASEKTQADINYEKTLSPDGEYYKALEKAKTALEEAKTKYEAIRTSLKDLITDRNNLEDEIQANEDEKVLNKADKNKYLQTDEEDFNKKYSNYDLSNLATGTKISINKDKNGKDQKVSKNDLRGLIARYRGTMESDKKKLYANQFKQLWELAEPSIQNDSSLRAAYNIMHDDMVAIGKKKEESVNQ